MPQMTPYGSKHIGERRLVLSIPRGLLEGNIPCGMEAVAKQRDKTVESKETRRHPLDRLV